MVGLIDRAYVALARSSGVDLNSYRVSPEVIDRNSSEHWICFLPEVARKMKGFTPKTGNVTSYYLPGDLSSFHPREIRGLLDRVADDAYRLIEFSNQDPAQFNLLGVSLGSSIPFFLIGKDRYSVNRVVAVTPASNLSVCALSSIATRKRVEEIRSAGEDPALEYSRHLADFNPISHIDKIDQHTRVECHVGGADLFVPYLYAHELVQDMRSKGKNPKVIEYPRSGHVTTIWHASRNWQKNIR